MMGREWQSRRAEHRGKYPGQIPRRRGRNWELMVALLLLGGCQEPEPAMTVHQGEEELELGMTVYEGEGFSLTVPEDLSVTHESPVEDFVLYTFKQGERNLLSVYAGNHPSYPLDEFKAASEESATVNGYRARFRSLDGTGGTRDREVLVDISSEGDWPQVIHMWYLALPSEMAETADRIIASVQSR